jgi:hypothetical protein
LLGAQPAPEAALAKNMLQVCCKMQHNFEIFAIVQVICVPLASAEDHAFPVHLAHAPSNGLSLNATGMRICSLYHTLKAK